MFDGGLTGLADNFVGSFALDLNKFAIYTKVFWITRLNKLLKYIEHKQIRADAVKPIRSMINELKNYLMNQSSEDLNLDSRPESNRMNSERSLLKGLENQSFRQIHADSSSKKVQANQAERRLHR